MAFSSAAEAAGNPLALATMSSLVEMATQDQVEPGRGKKRVLRAMNTDEKVHKKIQDNFKDFSPLETDGVKVDNLTLREYLKKAEYDKRAGKPIRSVVNLLWQDAEGTNPSRLLQTFRNDVAREGGTLLNSGPLNHGSDTTRVAEVIQPRRHDVAHQSGDAKEAGKARSTRTWGIRGGSAGNHGGRAWGERGTHRRPAGGPAGDPPRPPAGAPRVPFGSPAVPCGSPAVPAAPPRIPYVRVDRASRFWWPIPSIALPFRAPPSLVQVHISRHREAIAFAPEHWQRGILNELALLAPSSGPPDRIHVERVIPLVDAVMHA